MDTIQTKNIKVLKQTDNSLLSKKLKSVKI